MAQENSRKYYIDFLKCVGLSGILLAHAQPPFLINFIRDFDVPLMVLLSAILSEYSYGRISNSPQAAKKYILSRFKRLVFPTWIFLCFFFAFNWLVRHRVYEIQYYIDTFALTRYGMGYVWIILVYVYCGLLTPLFHETKWSLKYCLIAALLYLIYEIAYCYQVGTDSRLLMSTFYYIVPYGTLAFFGYHFNRIRTKTKLITLVASFLAFSVCMIYYWISQGAFQSVQIAKYPPRIYFLSYGIMCSVALLLFFEKHSFKWFSHPVIRFISTHSMWIYLWHIFWLTVYNMLHLPGDAWMLKFVFAYICSVVTVMIVNKCLDCLERKIRLPVLKYLRG